MTVVAVPPKVVVAVRTRDDVGVRELLDGFAGFAGTGVAPVNVDLGLGIMVAGLGENGPVGLQTLVVLDVDAGMLFSSSFKSLTPCDLGSVLEVGPLWMICSEDIIHFLRINEESLTVRHCVDDRNGSVGSGAPSSEEAIPNAIVLSDTIDDNLSVVRHSIKDTLSDLVKISLKSRKGDMVPESMLQMESSQSNWHNKNMKSNGTL